MRFLLLLVFLALLAAGGWVGLSVLAAPDPGKVPLGTTVARSNRLAGEWLIAHSFPRPPCGDRTGAAGLDAYLIPGAAAQEVPELYSWTDEQGEVHWVEDLGEVPERFRGQAKVDALPSVSVYRGQYSKLKVSFAGVKPATPRRPAGGRGLTAIVYSAEWCGACKSAKAFLGGLGVAVEERDIDKDPRALAELASISGKDAAIPVTVIGKKVVGGFDEAELRAAVEAAGR